MKKNFLIQTIFILMALLIAPKVNSAWAAFLKFTPSSVTGSIGTNFDIKVDIDTDGEEIIAFDARILYPSNLIELQSIKEGTFITIGDKDTTELGKIYVNGVVPDPATSIKGQGTAVTLTFKPKANGSDKLTFVCIPGETAFDSNIGKNDINTTDIIVCSKNGESAVTVGGGPTATPGPTATSGPTPTTGAGAGVTQTPTPTTGTGGVTSTPSPTSSVTGALSPTPKALPSAGATQGYNSAFKLVIPGTILLLIGVGARMLL